MFGFFKKLLGLQSVDFAELKRNGAIIIDVRSKGEFAGGHIKGSLNIPLNTLSQNLNILKDKNKTIIIDVAIVSAVTFKNSKGVPTKSAVVKKVSPRNIKINFLFIVVVCSLCRVSLATNGKGLREVRDN